MAAGHRGKHAMVVRSLSFSYTPNVADSEVLQGVGFKVPFGARVVLVGLNGAGKSTLLSILAGQRMVPDGAVTVLGEDAFRGQAAKRRLVLISSEWTAAVAGMNSASAAELLAAAVERVCEDEREETATRGRQLAELLGVDGLWHVYALSEGQRRRLHLVIKLMPLYDVVLLDEATTDLDIVARRNLLLFLRADSAKRRATVIYCTHIFDGLDGWASHVAYVQKGSLVFSKHGSTRTVVPAGGGLRFALRGGPRLHRLARTSPSSLRDDSFRDGMQTKCCSLDRVLPLPIVRV